MPLRKLYGRSIHHPGCAEKSGSGPVSTVRLQSHPTYLHFLLLLRIICAERGSSIQFSNHADGNADPADFTSPFLRIFDMSAVDDETSLMVNIEVQIIQNMGISRYFAAAGLVFLMYDTVLTIGEEVSRF